MTPTWRDFVCGGVHYSQHATTFEISVDQTAYINKLQLCSTSGLRGVSPGILCSPSLHAQFHGVLDEVSVVILTRPDIAVYVAALKRQLQAPQVIHAKRLNAVVRWVKRNPRPIVYKRSSTMTDSSHV